MKETEPEAAGQEEGTSLRWELGLGQQTGRSPPGILNEAVRLLPVRQQLGRFLIPDTHVVIGEALREEVVDLSGHVQDVAHPVPEGPNQTDWGRGTRLTGHFCWVLGSESGDGNTCSRKRTEPATCHLALGRYTVSLCGSSFRVKSTLTLFRDSDCS